MNLYEYESKKILNFFKLKVPLSFISKKVYYLKNYFYKIQVFSNYRKKCGGVKNLHSYFEICTFFYFWIKNKFKNNIIHNILIEKKYKIKNELYFSLYFENNFLFLILSNKGGINVESQLKINFFKIKFNFIFFYYNIINYLKNILINNNIIKKLILLFYKLFNIIYLKKYLLIEINPLSIINNDIYIIDSKIIKEKNVILLHSNIVSNIIKVNIVNLKGNVCCFINGAGLALKILDILSFNNLKCSHFIDLSGKVNEKIINNLIKIFLISNFKILFINLFGGIVSCYKILFGILNLFYYDFKFKILLKVDGTSSKILIKKMINIKNLIICNEKNFLLIIKFLLKND